MYHEFFGLAKPPFRITPDTNLFYAGSDRGATLQAVTYAILAGEGIIKVVGEVGTGKTMLCRMLPSQMGGFVEWVYLAHPNLSPDQILQEIACEMGLEVDDCSDKLKVMRMLQVALLERHSKNQRVVVLVEEAQEMPLETLEELRLLSNLETDEHKLLQIILFGQPELDEKLSIRKIRQLRERITHSLYLSPLPLKDIHEYLNFRIRAAGYSGPDLFSHRAAKAVEKYSCGLIRRINILADKSLLAAYAKNNHHIDLRDIKKAAKDSDYLKKSSFWPWSKAVSSIVIILASSSLVEYSIDYEQITGELTSLKRVNLEIESK